MDDLRIAEGWGVIVLLEELRVLANISHGKHEWSVKLAGASGGTGVWDCYALVNYTNPDETDWPTDLTYGFPARHDVLLGRPVSTLVYLHPLLATAFQAGRYRHGEEWVRRPH